MNGLVGAFQVEQMLFNLVGLRTSAHKAQHWVRKLERERNTTLQTENANKFLKF